MADLSGFATWLIERVYRNWQVDDEWSVGADGRFTWWPHLLAQQVWARIGPTEDEQVGVKLTAETVVVEDLSHLGAARHAAAALNLRTPGFFAWVDEPSRTLRFTATMYGAPGMEPHLRLFDGAAIRQATFAHWWGPELAQRYGGRFARSAHPETGPRPVADDMLSWLIHQRQRPESVIPLHVPQDAWELMASATADGLEQVLGGQQGQVQLDDDQLTYGTPFFPKVEGPSFRTAAIAETRPLTHPYLGACLLHTLGLPVRASDPAVAAAMVNELNRLEAVEWTWCSSLGGWASAAGQPWWVNVISAFEATHVLFARDDGELSFAPAAFVAPSTTSTLAGTAADEMARTGIGWNDHLSGFDEALDAAPAVVSDFGCPWHDPLEALVADSDGFAGCRDDEAAVLMAAPAVAVFGRWGWFNPAGRTLTTLEVLDHPTEDLWLIAAKCRHPFSPAVDLLAVADPADGHDAAATLAWDAVVELADDPEWSILPVGSLPEFVTVADHDGPGATAFKTIAARSAGEANIDLTALTDWYVAAGGHPWVRLDPANVTAAVEPLDLEDADQPVEGWWAAVTDAGHVVLHELFLPGAWDGAIRFLEDARGGDSAGLA